MSGTVIREFLVGLGFEIDGGSLSKFTEGISSASTKVAAIGTAAVAAAGAITAFVSSVANKFDQIGDLADRTNSTADSIMRLGYVATLTGSSIEAVNVSVESLSRVAGEAALGIGRGAKIFEDLGLSANDSNGRLKDTSILMAEIGDKIKDMGRGEQIAALSKLGIDPTMMNALTTDVSSLAAEFDNLYRNAGIDANDAAIKAGEFNDSLDRLILTFDAIKSAVALNFMGKIKNGIDSLRKFLIENMPKVISAISPIVGLILRIAESFLKLANRAGSAIGVMIENFNNLNDKTDGWAGYILAALAAWKLLNLSFLASPLGIILLLAAAIALLVDDFLTWKEGGQALINWGSDLGITLQWAAGIVGSITAAFVTAKVATMAWSVVIGVLNGVLTFARTTMLLFNAAIAANPIGATIIGVLALIAAGKLLIDNWDTVKTWFSSFFDWITNKFKNLAEWNISGFFGMGEASQSMLAPSPQAAATVAGGAQSLSQKTEIIVNGSASPEATARVIAGQQNRVNADLARNMKGAAR